MRNIIVSALQTNVIAADSISKGILHGAELLVLDK